MTTMKKHETENANHNIDDEEVAGVSGGGGGGSPPSIGGPSATVAPGSRRRLSPFYGAIVLAGVTLLVLALVATRDGRSATTIAIPTSSRILFEPYQDEDPPGPVDNLEVLLARLESLEACIRDATFRVDSATGDLIRTDSCYGDKNLGSVAGATGPKGETGHEGAIGPQGPQGPAGTSGGVGVESRLGYLEEEVFTKTVFVSSVNYNGAQIGSVSDADLKCQTLAENAKLKGTYMAWISDGDSTPATRFLKSSPGPYILVNGDVVANNWAGLADGKLKNRITLTEKGATKSTFVWTGTKWDGTAAPFNCDKWTSNVNSQGGAFGHSTFGIQNSESHWWSAWNNVGCSKSYAIYCFEQYEYTL